MVQAFITDHILQGLQCPHLEKGQVIPTSWSGCAGKGSLLESRQGQGEESGLVAGQPPPV